MNTARAISVRAELERLRFLPDRTPQTTDAQRAGAFARLAAYRDGAIFIGHYAGTSEWERHAQGDEIVFVLEGETTLFLLSGDTETPHRLRAGELLVVPQGTWHRFETPNGVKIMAVTPHPTEHSVRRPQNP